MTRAGWGYDDQPVTSLAIDPDPDPPPCGEGIILRRTSPARDVLLRRHAAGNRLYTRPTNTVQVCRGGSW
jgi:hypothetical protein